MSGFLFPGVEGVLVRLSGGTGGLQTGCLDRLYMVVANLRFHEVVSMRRPRSLSRSSSTSRLGLKWRSQLRPKGLHDQVAKLRRDQWRLHCELGMDL